MSFVRSRRHLLRGALAAPAIFALSACASRRGGRGGAPIGPSGFDAWLDAWAERGRAIAAGQPHDARAEDALVHELCASLSRFEPGRVPRAEALTSFGEGLRSGPVRVEGALLLVELELGPHAVVPAHNHVGYDFVSVGLSGEAQVRHYEPLAGAPAPDPDPARVDGRVFQVAEVQRVRLSPGRCSSLTRARANIHWLRAGPEGARVLDVGLHFPDPGPGPRQFSALDIYLEARDRERGIYDARWIGDPYR
ncbi:hypothetical protein PPSIR1_13180 [Plesiocystis pacifica SIR-1]|uniref:Uncharacterized protein n=1 Tax=Plesiocystis pacifica SIR-1 TaxID=391625 RepID=A6GAY3_9BACT|nr:hypothetical protein [Plesiocystis pacifica]EDM76968.1 hypothetical protein PPSIR1_13180 [Plesiocystis pacifica SIR-1]